MYLKIDGNIYVSMYIDHYDEQQKQVSHFVQRDMIQY